MLTRVKSLGEIAAMREGGRMLATVLQYLSGQTKPGISTKELADIAGIELKKLGGAPAFLGYQGFPDLLCVSINDEVVHGIPSPNRFVKSGDIVSLDFGVKYRNMITDAAISVLVDGDQKSKQLVETTERSLMAGIDTIKVGIKTGDIGNAVEKVLNAKYYGIVRDLVGHGVGHHLHEDPNIPNYGLKGTGTVLKEHMTIAVEPMATLGGDDVYVDGDGWTIKTRDGSWSAHFEHTVLVNGDDAEILTEL